MNSNRQAGLAPSRAIPLLVFGRTKSRCCGVPTVYVRSMDGGFVTRNCFRCNGYRSVCDGEFLALDVAVACEACATPMRGAKIGKNFGFECDACGVMRLFAEVLPHYTIFNR